jgi:hypothetical protein
MAGRWILGVWASHAQQAAAGQVYGSRHIVLDECCCHNGSVRLSLFHESGMTAVVRDLAERIEVLARRVHRRLFPGGAVVNDSSYGRFHRQPHMTVASLLTCSFKQNEEQNIASPLFVMR